MSVSSSVAKTLMWIAIVIVGALLLYMVFGAVMVATWFDAIKDGKQ
jgi:hypothetical protein